MGHTRFAGCLLMAVLGLGAQAPAGIDAEGNLLWLNKLGRYPLQRKGVWKVEKLYNPERAAGMAPATAAEVQAMTATLDRLTAVMQATPEAVRMQGYWMKESRTFYYAKPLRFGARFFPFALEDVLDKGVFVPQWTGETESVAFLFNELPGAVGRRVLAGEVYLRPRVTGTFRGFPVLEGADLLIARPGRDPWAAVSYGEALRLALPLLEKDRATAEQRLADLKKKDAETQAPVFEQQMRAQLEKNYGVLRGPQPEKWKMREASMVRELAYLREQSAKRANPQRDKDGTWYWNPVEAHADGARRMAALTASDGAAPGCFREAAREAAEGRYALNGMIERLATDEACEAIVKDNNAYFDGRLPRTDAQILIVRSIGRCGSVKDGQFVAREKPLPDKPSHGCTRHPIFWEQMDWAKAGALVIR